MRGAGIVVREAEPSDAVRVCTYLAELIAEDLPVLVLFDRPPSVEAEERFLRRYRDAANSLFLVAIHEEQVVGQLELAGGWQPKRAHSASLAMSVHRDWRGRGVGTRLLEEMLAWVEQHPSLSRIELEVLANNARAQQLYERFEFRVEGRREAAVLDRGTPVDSILMARLWRR